MIHQCKKCLLLESAQRDAYDEISQLIAQMDDILKVNDAEYEKRLAFCKECEFLISGMCRKCGCYVELRAIQKQYHCPDVNNRYW